MTERNRQLVVTYIEALGAGDAAVAAACLAPNATIVGKGFGKFAGVCESSQFLEQMAALNQLAPGGLRFKIHSVTAEGDRVVVECEGDATLCNGEPYRNQYAMVFTLRDGKIAQVNEYLCTKLADEVLYPLVMTLN